jgi:hypothetical protein
MKGEPMKKNVKFRVTSEDVTMANGEVLTEADFERMATEAEAVEIDVERLLDRQRRGVGRPSLGEGISPVLQIRIDEQMRQKLADRAKREHTTPSRLAREVLRTFLAS